MADVKILSRRHYSGADAEKANITGLLGDTYAGNDSGKFYYWNDSLNAWKTGLGYEYVPRKPAAWDKVTGDFTLDGTPMVNGLDLSAIVPAGAVAVNLVVEMNGGTVGKAMTFWPNATAVRCLWQGRIQVANNYISSAPFVLPIDADRLIDYDTSNAPNITAFNLAVLGWWI